jgi:hypothetical protein
MADPLSVALMLGLLGAGVHPQGHVVAGNEVGIPARVDYSRGVEDWDTEAGDWRKQAKLHAGGFEAQNLAQRLFPEDESLRYANAIYKALYPFIVGKASRGRTAGDIENLKSVTGNRKVGQMMVADALSDLLFDNAKRDISFRTENGTPALMFNVRF